MMDEVDRLLVDAGERWRNGQRPAGAIDPAVFVAGRRATARDWRWTATPMALAAVIVAIVASYALGRLTAPGPSVGTGPTASGLALASPSIAPSPSESAVPSSASNAPCDVTRPDPPFVPPEPFLRTPPERYASDWFGSEHLWAMLAHDGEVWKGWVASSPPVLPQKTFWWSADWKPDEEPQPTIVVTGRRLGGPESFTFGPGTNASADFGTAMLVGIDIPAYGCWELTAQYRLATLTYVVSVGR
jgi:hypothetical protein